MIRHSSQHSGRSVSRYAGAICGRSQGYRCKGITYKPSVPSAVDTFVLVAVPVPGLDAAARVR